MHPKNPITILLVEDNPGDADLIRELLYDAGQSSAYAVTHVSRLREAIRLLSGGSTFDVIVSDLKLPDSEGAETILHLSQAAGPIPLVVITSQSDSEFALSAIQSGVQDYLPKGKFDGEMLVRSIRYAMERKKQDEALKSSEERFRSLVQSVKDYAIFHLDSAGCITTWNEGAQNIFGWSDREIIGRHFSTLFLPEDVADDIPMSELVSARDNGSSVFEGCQITKDGMSIDAVVTTTALLSPDWRVIGYSQIIRNVTERKKADDVIRYQASHDLLTGLLNRKSFDEQFSVRRAVADQQEHTMALFFLDLDRFKQINDSLGHAVGDSILREVATRLRSSVRRHDTICRFGGDEFVLLVSDYGTEENLRSLAEKILHQFSSAFQIENHVLQIGTSMGIALFPNDGKNVHTLLKNADTALYRAKDGGRNRYTFYDSGMNSHLAAKHSLESSLRNGIDSGEFELYYQPIVELASGNVRGAEALIRWNHPERGVLLPGEFIPIAEESGTIVKLGLWVFEETCRQAHVWNSAGYDLKLSLNLSGRQFSEKNMFEEMERFLEGSAITPSFLEAEVTESVAMESLEATSSQLKALKDKGISITIDDFGTGYSSLSYLKNFPATKLKIDKSFVLNAFDDPQDSALIKGIISMGHSLNLTVCAEGIESQGRFEMLKSLGCDLGQGFYISPPLPASQFEEWMNHSDREGHRP